MSSVWDRVVGQAAAVGQLEAAAYAPSHAYLLVGPHGSTKTEAARAFAAVLLTGSDDPDTEDARRALTGQHRNLFELTRTADMTDKDWAEATIKRAGLAPDGDDTKVIIVNGADELSSDAVVRMLKTIEEPTPSTQFILLAQQIHPQMLTLASRCTVIEFHAITDQMIADQLILEGTDPQSAVEAAASARGDLTHARLLATDPQLAPRRRLFAAIPHRIDGTGATAVALAAEMVDSIEQASAPIRHRHRDELALYRNEIAQLGRQVGSTKEIEARHKREVRRYQRGLYRDGLAVMAATYRDALLAGTFRRPEAIHTAIARIHQVVRALDRSANTALQLQVLIWDLPNVPVHEPATTSAAVAPDR